MIIDIRDWEREEYGIGTRKKYLYIDPITRRKAFFKYPVVDLPTGEYIIGEVWSEKVASDVGKAIGVPTPEVAIAKNEDVYGSLSFNFLEDGQELHHGADFLESFYRSLEIGEFDPRNTRLHKLDIILEIMKGLNLVPQFLDILIFDALIGNTDRHSENWGIISNINNKKVLLAPAYDNTSSLAREYKDDKYREALLNDEELFKRYIMKSAACISTGDNKRTRHFELMKLLIEKYPNRTSKSLKKVRNLYEGNIEGILSLIPGEIMSDRSKALAKKILIHRRRILLEMRKG